MEPKNIKNRYKIRSPEKKPTCFLPMKTQHFLMILGFARFKNRFGKIKQIIQKIIPKIIAKNIETSSNKSSKMELKSMKKTSKSRVGKKSEKCDLRGKRFRASKLRKDITTSIRNIQTSCRKPHNSPGRFRKVTFGGVQGGKSRRPTSPA